MATRVMVVGALLSREGSVPFFPWLLLCSVPLPPSYDQLVQDVARHVREAEIAAAVAIRQLLWSMPIRYRMVA